MKVVHFGDLHVWRTGFPLSEALYPKRWLGSVNLLIRRAAKFPPAYRAAVFAAVAAERPEVAVFTGDFSQGSLDAEFRECAALFAPLREQLGERLFALPGNHDTYTPASVRRRRLQRHLPWVHTEAACRVDIGPRLSLVGVNHSEPFALRSNGVVRPQVQQTLREELARCRAESRTVILVGHYPYATPPAHPESPEHRLLGSHQLAELTREFAPPLYLHGHKHVRWAIRPSETPATICLNCGSCSMRSESPLKQAGFLSWEQREDGSLHQLTAHTYDGHTTWRKTPLPLP